MPLKDNDPRWLQLAWRVFLLRTYAPEHYQKEVLPAIRLQYQEELTPA